MPRVPDLKWTQTATALNITLTMRSVEKNQPVVSGTEIFLKVNCPPFLGEWDLFDQVKADQIVVTSFDDELSIQVPKVCLSLCTPFHTLCSL